MLGPNPSVHCKKLTSHLAGHLTGHLAGHLTGHLAGHLTGHLAGHLTGFCPEHGNTEAGMFLLNSDQTVQTKKFFFGSWSFFSAPLCNIWAPR